MAAMIPAPLREPDAPLPGATRYTRTALPAYRYVPRLNPHPCADPRGHSYHPSGHGPPPPPLLPPERWRECEGWLFGVDLYNLAYWWEAHETWEAIWKQAAPGHAQRRFLQGLIQISAAHLKRHIGEDEAVRRLLERSRGHLDAVQSAITATGDGVAYMGLDLERFRDHCEAWFSERTGAGYPLIALGGNGGNAQQY